MDNREIQGSTKAFYDQFRGEDGRINVLAAFDAAVERIVAKAPNPPRGKEIVHTRNFMSAVFADAGSDVRNWQHADLLVTNVGITTLAKYSAANDVAEREAKNPSPELSDEEVRQRQLAQLLASMVPAEEDSLPSVTH